MMQRVKFFKYLFALTALLGSATALALEVNITPDMPYVDVMHQGKKVRVQRIQDQSHVVDPSWAKTSRKCPPFCIQPIAPVEGVHTVGEVEVLEFLRDKVNTGKGFIIDARVESWHKKGTIPGSISVPFTVFDGEPTTDTIKNVLTKFGAKPRDGVGGFSRTMERWMADYELMDAHLKTGYWDFSEAKELLLWCNGAWCGQSPRAIRGLVERLGYPADRIYYYRGGMQSWEIMGLTTIIPND